jgi:hypothetical protein
MTLVTEFSKIGDSEVGFLSFSMLEELPFTPARFFWISGTPVGVTRGEHAHKKCHQFIICLAGEYQVTLEKAGESSSMVLYEGEGIHVLPGTWGSQTPTANGSVLGVFASLPYSEDDYIRNFQEFLLWTLAKQE